MRLGCSAGVGKSSPFTGRWIARRRDAGGVVEEFRFGPPPPPFRFAKRSPSPQAGRIFAALALLLPTPALADGVVDNVNGITLDAEGKVVRFNGLLIGKDGKIIKLLDRRGQAPRTARLLV